MDIDNMNIISSNKPNNLSVDKAVIDSKINNINAKKIFDDKKSAKKDLDISETNIKKAIDSANKIFIPSQRKLEYSIHEKTHQIMVKVIDLGTKEVIREIPPKKLLDSYASMLELAGLIVDKQS